MAAYIRHMLGKLKNLDRHINHSANNTDGYICQRIPTYLKK